MNSKNEQVAVQNTPTHPVASASTQQMRVSSQALLGSSGELVIEHGGREYRLRVTQNGKLILTA
jgi:Hemin uptake protein